MCWTQRRSESFCPCQGHFLTSPTLSAGSVQVWAEGFLVLLPSGMWRCPISLDLSTTALTMSWSSTWARVIALLGGYSLHSTCPGTIAPPKGCRTDAHYSNCLGQSTLRQEQGSLNVWSGSRHPRLYTREHAGPLVRICEFSTWKLLEPRLIFLGS